MDSFRGRNEHHLHHREWKDSCRRTWSVTEKWIQLQHKRCRLHRTKQQFGIDYMNRIIMNNSQRQQQPNHHQQQPPSSHPDEWDDDDDIRIKECFRSYHDQITCLEGDIKQLRQQIQETTQSPTCHHRHREPPSYHDHYHHTSQPTMEPECYHHHLISEDPTTTRHRRWKESCRRRLLLSEKWIQLQMKRRQLHRTKQSFGIDYMNLMMMTSQPPPHHHIHDITLQQCLQDYQQQVNRLEDDMAQLHDEMQQIMKKTNHPSRQTSDDDNVTNLSAWFDQSMNIRQEQTPTIPADHPRCDNDHHRPPSPSMTTSPEQERYPSSVSDPPLHREHRGHNPIMSESIRRTLEAAKFPDIEEWDNDDNDNEWKNSWSNDLLFMLDDRSNNNNHNHHHHHNVERDPPIAPSDMHHHNRKHHHHHYDNGSRLHHHQDIDHRDHHHHHPKIVAVVLSDGRIVYASAPIEE